MEQEDVRRSRRSRVKEKGPDVEVETRPTKRLKREGGMTSGPRTTRCTVAAREAVFNTAELLENILVYLSPFQLFTIQRVNHRFNAIITSSPAIKRKQFLEVDNANPNLLWQLNHSKKKQTPEAPYEIIQTNVPPSPSAPPPPSPSAHGTTLAHAPPTAHQDFRKPVHLCPLLRATTPTYFLNENPGLERLWRPATLRLLPDLNLPMQPPTASWRQIHLTDPPTRNARMMISFHLPPSPPESTDPSYAMVSDWTQISVTAPPGSTGLTLGHAVDALLRRQEEFPGRPGWRVFSNMQKEVPRRRINRLAVLPGCRFGPKGRLVKKVPRWVRGDAQGKKAEEGNGGPVAVVDAARTYLMFYNRLVVPTEEEWQAVGPTLAERER